MEFEEFPKMGRLSREVIVTEKIDGTNAQILIVELDGFQPEGPAIYSSEGLALYAGSRTRWITPKEDNYGFAKWALDHAEELLCLSPGRHFGEWWGNGIQRGYGVPDKRWSLFNVARWHLRGETPRTTPTQDPRVVNTTKELPACCGLVPVLYQGLFDTARIDGVLTHLEATGSKAAPGFMKPEGVVVFHPQGDVGFKKTLGGDGHKGAAIAKARGV